jgi:hypothetical protein
MTKCKNCGVAIKHVKYGKSYVTLDVKGHTMYRLKKDEPDDSKIYCVQMYVYKEHECNS